MRTPLLAANWKMHKTVPDAIGFVTAFAPRVAAVTDADIVLAPPFTALAAVADACRNSRVAVAGQNLHWASQGAFTGEISAGMLVDAGATHVILGHSERRQLFAEDDAVVARKTRAAIDAGLAPIVCVGETLDQREAGETLAVLGRQLEGSLAGVTPAELAALVVAYEPVWAIGTGRTATPDQAQDAHAHIRRRLAQIGGGRGAGGGPGPRGGEGAAERCRLLYGGSVKPANAEAIAGQTDVDGALVGGASLDPGSFAEIVDAARRAAL